MLYTERQSLSQKIITKFNTGKALTNDEKRYIIEVLTDPLQEFCKREGTFRLIEMLDVDPKVADFLEDEAAEVIRDDLDYNENLYDQFDSDLRELLTEQED